jgi:hypothetical protein
MHDNHIKRRFYETRARARTIDDLLAGKDFALEATKPLFKEHNYINGLSLKNLHVYHTFMESFKILNPTERREYETSDTPCEAKYIQTKFCISIHNEME